jgi:hypothetical protein
MKYSTPLRGTWLDAYLSMPKTRDGHVVSLFYCPPGQLAAYEAAWRDWLAKTPKWLWPEWVEPWAAKRTAQAKAAA